MLSDYKYGGEGHSITPHPLLASLPGKNKNKSEWTRGLIISIWLHIHLLLCTITDISSDIVAGHQYDCHEFYLALLTRIKNRLDDK